MHPFFAAGLNLAIGSSLLAQEQPEQDCDPSYPELCIPPGIADLDCSDVEFRNFRVEGNDPHNFDEDSDGIGCERGNNYPPVEAGPLRDGPLESPERGR